MNFETCYYCHRDAEYLCDQPIKGPEGKYIYPETTCDKQLCDHHRFHEPGNIFICGSDGCGYEDGYEDGFDYCFEHGVEHGFDAPDLKGIHS